MPRIRLLRGGVEAVALEWPDPRALFRAPGELQACDGAMPPRWKTVQGLGGWIEKAKVGNGADDGGRVYARLDRADRSWAVPAGHKVEQERDILWLRRQ